MDIANLIISSQFVLSSNENHFTSVAQKSALLSEKEVYLFVVLISSHPLYYSSIMKSYKTISNKKLINPDHQESWHYL